MPYDLIKTRAKTFNGRLDASVREAKRANKTVYVDIDGSIYETTPDGTSTLVGGRGYRVEAGDHQFDEKNTGRATKIVLRTRS